MAQSHKVTIFHVTYDADYRVVCDSSSNEQMLEVSLSRDGTCVGGARRIFTGGNLQQIVAEMAYNIVWFSYKRECDAVERRWRPEPTVIRRSDAADGGLS